MYKNQLRALEKVFEAEIYNRLPFSSNAKIYQKLYELGYLQPMVRELGGRFPVKLTGYELTHAGRYAYCSSCTENDSDQPTQGENNGN